MKRRIMAWVLCLMMILTMLPTPTYAAEVPSTAEQTEVGIEAPAEEHTSQPMKIEAKASAANSQMAPPEEAGEQSEGNESGEVKGDSGHEASEHASAAHNASTVEEPTVEGQDGGASQQTDPSQDSQPGADESAGGDEVVTDGSEGDGEPTPVPTEVADAEPTEEPAPEVVEDVEQVTGEVASAPTDEPPLIVEVIEDEPTEVLSVKLSRHEDDEAYTVAGEDIIFKVEIIGGAAGGYDVTYRVEHAGDTVYDSENIEESEPSTKMVTEKISTTVSEGEFSYPASQVGVYRLTVTVADEAGNTAKDQLSFAVISKTPAYVCGKEEHTHTSDCYAMVEVADNNPYGGMGIEEPGANGELTLKDAQLICKYSYEHTHDASCLPSCGKIAHKHVKECYNDDGELICGLEEHAHSTEACYAGVAELVESDPGIAPILKEGEVDLKSYVKDKGGDFTFSLAPSDGSEMKRDEEGGYIIDPKKKYDLSLQMYFKEGGGFVPGVDYVYEGDDFVNFFNNDYVKFDDNPSGKIVAGDTEYGEWYIDGDGRLHATFNENARSLTENVQLALKTQVKFYYTDTPFDMPGGTKITMEAPEDRKGGVDKQGDIESDYTDYWGKKFDEDDDDFVAWTKKDNQIVWRVKVDSSTLDGDTLNRFLAGLVVKDKVGDNSSIQPQDKVGAVFRLKLWDANGTEHSHVWRGTLDYDEDGKGWSYTVPDKIECIKHTTKEDIEDTDAAGSDGKIDLNDPAAKPWTLYVYYTTTVDSPTPEYGSVQYKNTVLVGEDKKKETTVTRQYGDKKKGTIVKNGDYDENGDINWTIDWYIPGWNTSYQPPYGYYFEDKLRFYDDGADSGDGDIESPYNLFNNIEGTGITITVDGIDYPLKPLDKADPDIDEFAYVITREKGKEYNPYFYLYHRCECKSKETCADYSSSKRKCKKLSSNPNYCECWSCTQDVTIHFNYTTKKEDIYNELDKYDALNKIPKIKNRINQYGHIYNPATKSYGDDNGYTEKKLDLKQVFTKKVTSAASETNDYVCSYSISFNEGRLNLVPNPGDTLKVTDTMSSHLSYVEGSMVITEDDGSGSRELSPDEYTITESSGPNGEDILTIVFEHPKAAKYTLNYDAKLNIEASGTITYTNVAEVEYARNKLKSETNSNSVTGTSFDGRGYQVTIVKKDAINNEALKGAEFGFYDATTNHEMATGTTDRNGQIVFKSDVENLVLVQHRVYYIKETKQPDGYELDKTPHYFLFHVKGGDKCEICEAAKKEYEGLTVLKDKLGDRMYGGTLEDIYNNRKPVPYPPSVWKQIVDRKGTPITGDYTPQPENYPDFTFTLSKKASYKSYTSESRNNPYGEDEDDGVTMPDSLEVTIYGHQLKGTQTVENFGSIEFHKPGVFMFEISETPDSAGQYPDWTYDDQGPWTLVVTVEQNRDGNLIIKDPYYQRTENGKVVKVTGKESGQLLIPDACAHFINMYTPQPGKLSFEIEKIATGDGIENAEHEFTFTLTQAEKIDAEGNRTPAGGLVTLKKTVPGEEGAEPTETNVTLPAEIKVTIQKNAEGNWTATSDTYTLYFSEPGEYELTLSEKSLSDDAWTDKTGERKLHVTVGPNAVNGKYTVSGWIGTDEENCESVTDIAVQRFTHENYYEGKTSVSVEKVWLDENGEKIEAEDKHPGEVKVQLKRKAKDVEGADFEAVDDSAVKLPDEGNWSYKWDDLDKYDKDGHEYVYTVEETEAEAGWVPSVTATDPHDDNGADYQFTVTNKFTPALYAPKAEKIVQAPDADWPDDGFSFKIAADSYTGEASIEKGDMPVPASDTVTIKEDTDQPASFGDMKFTAPGTYTYTITEDQPDPIPDGWAYDDVTHKLVIVVGTGDNNELVIKSVQYDEEEIAIGETAIAQAYASIENTWTEPKVEDGPEINKEITGDADDAADRNFTFNVKLVEQDGEKVETSEDVDPNSQEVTITTSGKKGSTAEDIFTFTKSGTYKFKISEEKPDDATHYQKEDLDVFYWTVTVFNNADGKLEVKDSQYTDAKGESVEKVQYDNPYTATVDVTVEKVWDENGYTGKIPTEEEIKVQLYQDGEAYGEPQTLKPDEDSAKPWTAEWKDLPKYKDDDSGEPHTYTVKEVDVPDGWIAKVGDPKDEDGDGNWTIEITNVYEPSPDTWGPAIEKTVKGKEAPAQKFEFTITDVTEYADGAAHAEFVVKNEAGEYEADESAADGKTVEIAVDKMGDTEASQTVPADDLGDIVQFTAPGTYTFEIVENGSLDENWTKDEGKWTVTVVVEEAEGKLSVGKVTYTYSVEDDERNTDDANVAEFINTYTAKTEVQVEKKWVDAEGNELEDHPDSIEVELLAGGKSLDPKKTTELNSENDWQNTWEDLDKYGADNEPINYSVKETIPEPYTVTYSEDEDTSGNFSYTLTNKYAPAKYAPQVTKKWTGDLPDDWSAKFTFEIAGGENSNVDGKNATLPSPATLDIEIPGEGNETTGVTASFGEIEFPESGTYTFTITEQNATEPGWTKDKAGQWTVTVVVEKDAETGAQSIKSVTYERGTYSETYTGDGITSAAAAATFTNTYKPDEAPFAPQVKKEITGNKPLPSLEREFTFQLKDEEGTVLATGKTTGAGTVTQWFDKEDKPFSFNYDKAGNHTYTITEVGPDADDEHLGWTYDGTAWTVDVSVTDNGGALGVTASYTAENKTPSDEQATFTNTYSEDEYAPSIRKTLVTNHAFGKELTFSFTIAAEDAATQAAVEAGYVVLPTGNATVTVDGTNNSTSTGAFGPIVFHGDDIAPNGSKTYKFTISEVTPTEGTANGKWEKAADQTLEVTVTKAADGTLTVEGPATGNTFSFINTYTATTDITVIKEWKNNDHTVTTPERITVQLKRKTENDAGYANVPDGNVTLPEGNGVWSHSWKDLPLYDADGNQYDYTVEEPNVPNGWTADVGELTLGDDGVWTITITNSYEPTPASVKLPLKKTVEATPEGTAPEQTFTFTLAHDTSVEDEPTSGWTFTSTTKELTLGGSNTEQSIADAFGDIKFTKAGTYHFTVTETGHAPEDVPGWYYDTGVWKVTVTVTDVDGVLSAVVSRYEYTGDQAGRADVEFINNYNQPKTDVTVKKIWEHDGYNSGAYANARPASITVTLEAKIPGADGELQPYNLNLGEDFDPTATLEPTDWKASWNGLPKYAADGTTEIQYTVTEGDVKGYTQKPVQAVQGEDGNWTITLTNDYTPNPTVVIPKAYKTVVGADAPDDEVFNFTLTPAEGNPETGWSFKTAEGAEEPAASLSATVTGAGEAAFDPGIEFTQPGVYTFTIKEVAPEGEAANDDFAYDETEWTLTVTVTPNNTTGGLNVATEYSTGEGEAAETAERAEFTNTYTAKTAVHVTKQWRTDPGHTLPDRVTVELLVNGESTEPNKTTAELNASNGWKADWTNLPKYQGEELDDPIEYSVREVEVTGYKSSVAEVTKEGETEYSFEITNIQLTNLDVEKVWQDDDNRDGKRPTEIKVTLYANGAPYVPEEGSENENPVTLNAGNGWADSWKNLPKYDANGDPISYAVTEDFNQASVNYQQNISENVNGKFTITNTYSSEKTSKTVKKVWDDGENRDNKRPREIEVTLYANRTEYDEAGTANQNPVTLNADNGWQYTWKDLPVNENGTQIEYTVQETSTLPEDYSAAVTSGEGDVTFTVTNTYQPEVVNKSVTKVWEDDDNRDVLRPESIVVQLYANGIASGEPVKLNEDNGWSYEWTGLPKNDAGEEIEYTVRETSVPAGYTVEYGGTADAFTITNKHEPETVKRFVEKIWEDADDQDGLRPESIEVQLLADGDPYGEPVTLNEKNSWTYVWENLPKYVNEAGGRGEIEYSINEITAPEGYGTAITEGTMRRVSSDKFGFQTTMDIPGFTITNRHEPEVVNKSVTKVWADEGDQDGYRPNSIEAQLLADGEAYGSAVTLSEANSWSYSWENLPKNKTVEGETSEIKYTVEEVEVPEHYSAGYTTETDEETNTVKFIVTNTHTPETVDIDVTKIWDDVPAGASHPNSVQVQLYKSVNGGDPTAVDGPVTLPEGNSWTHTWADQPKYDHGNEITYTVEEVNIPAPYKMERSGGPTTGEDGEIISYSYTIKNTYAPAEYAPKVIKTWDGEIGELPENWRATFRFAIDGGKEINGGTSATLPEQTTVDITIPNGGNATAGVTASFGDIVFTESGTYSFTITESADVTEPGWTNDKASWNLTVVVTKEANGELKVNSVTYSKGDGTTVVAPAEGVTLADAAATFENTYAPGDGTFTPSIRKIVTGNGLNTLGESVAVNFTMTLKDASKAANVKVGAAKAEWKDIEKTLTVEKAKGWTASDLLGELHFTKPGTYEFDITEATMDGDWTANVTTYHLKVEVSNKLEDGHYKVTATYTVDDDVTDVKEITGDDDAFTFEYKNTYNPLTNVTVTKVWETNGNEVDIPTILVKLYKSTAASTTSVDAGQEPKQIDKENLTATWNDLPMYDGENLIQYSVQETLVNGEPLPKGWTSKSETLDPDNSYAITLTNSYNVEPTGYAPKVKKVVNGTVPEGYEQEFSFTLAATGDTVTATQPSEAGKKPAVEMPNANGLTAKVKGNGSATLGNITFNKAGVYEFTITENLPEPPATTPTGYTYDTKPWTVTVEVEDIDSVLTVTSVTYTQAGEDGKKVVAPAESVTIESAAATFTNEYKPEPADYSPEVTKVIKGNNGAPEKEFTFEMKEGDALIARGTVTGAGTVTWTATEGHAIPIKYEETGEHTYTITETTPDGDGYKCDHVAATVTVDVKDNNGALGTTVTIVKGEAEANAVTFTNVYQKAGTPLNVEKTFADGTLAHLPVDAAGNPDYAKYPTFTFTLKHDDTAEGEPEGGCTLPSGTSITLPKYDETGALAADPWKDAFGDITFTEAGEYQFTISETDDKPNDSWTYDTTAWNVTVVVEEITDENDPEVGGLTITSVTYERNNDSNNSAATFENSYQPEPTNYVVRVTKAITGDTPETDETFTFTLTRDANNSNGDDVTAPITLTVKGAGTTTYDSIHFTKAGTYKYTIAEDQPQTVPEGYTYDAGNWTLEIVVEDVDGALKVTSVTYTKDDGTKVASGEGNVTIESAAATFTNSYAAPVAKSVTITKEITGASQGDLDYLASLRTANVKNKSFEFVLTTVAPLESYANVKYGAGDNLQPVAELMRRADTPYIDKQTVTLEKLKEANWQKEAIFTQFVFSKGGVYLFKITENIEEGTGDDWNYDRAEWQVTVTVTDARDSAVQPAAAIQSPVLTAEVTTQKIVNSDGTTIARAAANAADEPIWFNNVYTMPTVDLGVIKVWANDSEALRPENVQVQLYRNGSEYRTSVLLDADNGWQYVWEDLPEFDENGDAYAYTVREVNAPADYRSSVSDEMQIEMVNADGTTTEMTGFTITNTYVPPTVARTVNKVWVDAGDLDGLRPGSITVQLLADGDVEDTVTLSAANGWSYRWGNLPRYRTGTLDEITYRVTESSTIAGYTSAVTNGATTFTITNTHEPAPVSYSVRKVWNDGGNVDRLRPDSIEVQLLANGTPSGETVTLNEANNWRYTWTGLTAAEGNARITYSVVEVNGPAEYTVAYTQNGTEFVITNSYEPLPRNTALTGTKVWIDQNDVRGLRPAAIQVRLYQNGVLMPGRVPTWTRNGNVWTYRFANLPYADENLQPYVYTVDEVPVPGYTTTVNGTTITNTVNPQTITIAGTKTWQDNNNAAGLRPTQIVVRLLRDGVVYREQTVMAANGWRYRFTNLPDSDPATGRMYTYTISEEIVNGYYTRVDGYNLINVLLPPDETTLINEYDTPLGLATEEELEGLVEIGDYDTPLWGGLLQTGDDLPAYPFVSGGIGVLALLALVVLDRKKRKKEQ